MSARSAIFMRRMAVAGIAMLVTACAGVSDENFAYTVAGLAVQPYPTNYKADLLAFMRTYLNDPRAVRDAAIAEPVQRVVGRTQRYVACVRYTATGKGDGSSGGGDRAAIYLDGRMERLLEKAHDLCADAIYAPFPEMEKLSR